MKIKYLGHSALLIEENNVKALIDPFLQNNPQYKEDSSDTKGITHIFITHAHGDHIGDALQISQDNHSTIICNAEIAHILYFKDKNLQLHPMHIGGRFSFDFGTVKMTPALHGSGYTENNKVYDGGTPCGFVIEINGKKIYHAGDTGLTMDMKLLEKEKIDLAFLPIGGNYTMDIEDAVEAARFVQAKVTLPIHYNTFSMIQADPLEFKKQYFEGEVLILEPGKSISI